MNRYTSKFIFLSLYLIPAILALTIIIEAVYITPSLAQTTGSYIVEVSRIINIPKNTPNSSSIVPNSTNLTNPTIPNSTNLTNAILTYQNNSYGIRIQYPANWTKAEQDVNPNDNITNIVIFTSPHENTSDNYSEYLVISMERLTDQNKTLEEYAASLITIYNKTLTDFNLIESNTNTTLAGGNNNPAYGLIYTHRVDGTNYKKMEIGTIIGDRIYFIKYSADEKQFSNYLPTIRMMINSLQIT
jgi:hypothetical protein